MVDGCPLVLLLKCVSVSRPFTDADIARSLLYLVSNDVGQIATLYALNHKIKNIYFGGFFLRHHPVSLHTVSYAVNYWSKGEVEVTSSIPHCLKIPS